MIQYDKVQNEAISHLGCALKWFYHNLGGAI